jgi:hypothetical protein
VPDGRDAYERAVEDYGVSARTARIFASAWPLFTAIGEQRVPGAHCLVRTPGRRRSPLRIPLTAASGTGLDLRGMGKRVLGVARLDGQRRPPHPDVGGAEQLECLRPVPERLGDPGGLGAVLLGALRATLYALYAILRLHTVQEDEAYLSLDEEEAVPGSR